MVSGFDHMTVVVSDLDEARRFFGLLGFKESKAVVVSGEVMSQYMGIPDWEAEHVTLELVDAPEHQEVQLLRFHTPPARRDGDAGTLSRLGFNHVCFRVDSLDETLERLADHGVKPKNEVLDFHGRKLVFLEGPEGLTVELAEWQVAPH